MSPGRARPLADYGPHWLPKAGAREKMGMALTCPIHKDHQVSFYFRHPMDGEAPQPLTPLVEVEDFLGAYDGKESFDDITLYFRAGDEGPLVAPCGATFWIIGGEVLMRPRRKKD